MLAATQHNESDIMNPVNPAQSAEYTHSCEAVTMPTPDSRRPGIEDVTTIRGSNLLTHVEAVNAVTTTSDYKSEASTDERVTHACGHS